MNDKEKVAFFDFCGTFVPFQSAEAYIKYVVKRTNFISVKFRNILYRFLHRFNLISSIERITKGRITNKKLFIYQIKGLSESCLNDFSIGFLNEVIKPNLVTEIMAEWKRLQNKGYRMVIVSGGLDIYLHYVITFLGGNPNDLFSTSLEFKNGKCTGKMSFDCMHDNKVKILEKYFKKDELDSIAYSDSDSDKPLLTWVTHGYYVIPVPKFVIIAGCKTFSYFY